MERKWKQTKWIKCLQSEILDEIEDKKDRAITLINHMADKNFHSGPSSLQACISVRIGNVLSLLSLLLHPELLKSFACPCFIVQLGAGLRRHSSLHSVILNYKVHPYCHIYCMLSFYCSMSARKLIFVKTSYQFTNTFMPII